MSPKILEKALKENRFHQERNNSENIQPDWRRTAKAINEQFIATNNLPDKQELRTAIDFLLRNPPKKQVLRYGHIQFVNTERSSDSDIEWLEVFINRVRSNLFHGGKFSYDHPRDTQLIQSSLIILDIWAGLNEELGNNLFQIQ